MAERATPSEHPLPAVLMHWVHLLSFFLLIGTGMVIHSHTDTGVTFATIRQTHFIAMYVFVLTAVTRIYWAFFGAGSSPMGKTYRKRDWKFFVMTGRDWRTLGAWIAYYLFIRKTRPFTEKYNPPQKLTYGLLFPLGILILALSGFAMFGPTAAAMAWYADLLGGLNGVRLLHYWTMWAMIIVFLIHVYLAVFEDRVQVPLMLFRHVPRAHHVPADHPAQPRKSADDISGMGV